MRALRSCRASAASWAVQSPSKSGSQTSTGWASSWSPSTSRPTAAPRPNRPMSVPTRAPAYHRPTLGPISMATPPASASSPLSAEDPARMIRPPAAVTPSEVRNAVAGDLRTGGVIPGGSARAASADIATNRSASAALEPMPNLLEASLDRESWHQRGATLPAALHDGRCDRDRLLAVELAGVERRVHEVVDARGDPEGRAGEDQRLHLAVA